MKFRFHRGSLADSIKTLVELKGRDDLVKHCQSLLGQDFVFEPSALKVEPYGSGGDERIGWEHVFVVTIEGYGVIGFTDAHC